MSTQQLRGTLAPHNAAPNLVQLCYRCLCVCTYIAYTGNIAVFTHVYTCMCIMSVSVIAVFPAEERDQLLKQVHDYDGVKYIHDTCT